MRGFLLCLGVFYLLLPTASFAQTLSNVTVKFESGLIAVHYDIESPDPSQLFEFYLYGSHDNYSSPLMEVTGDVGQKVSSGRQKVIYWDARKEFGNFKGDVNLKIKGDFYTPLVAYNDFINDQKIKKSKTMNITWEPVAEFEELTFEIVKNGSPITRKISIRNSGKYTWTVPGNYKAGDGYRVKLGSKENPMKYELSDEFTIKRKVPTLLKIAPVVVAGGVFVIMMGGDESPGGQETDESIPDPPNP